MIYVIEKGTIWKNGDRTCEFLQDLKPGDPITQDSMLIDGRRPELYERIPNWMINDGIGFLLSPPPGVEVIKPRPNGPTDE